MQVITKAEIARSVAERWKRAYYYGGEWGEWPTINIGSTREMYDQLVAAGENIAPEEVAAIIGNESWTRNRCMECGRDVEVTVRFVMEPGWEWADICPHCLRKALVLYDNAMGMLADSDLHEDYNRKEGKGGE